MAGTFFFLMLTGMAAAEADLPRHLGPGRTVMIIIQDAGQAGDFLEYAETLLKKGLQEEGVVIIDPELMEKIKADKLLFKAIANANASAMAEIATDYGADLLIRGNLSVDSRQKFAASWEGAAALSLGAIDTATAEQIAIVSSDPFGSSANPSPIEDSVLFLTRPLSGVPAPLHLNSIISLPADPETPKKSRCLPVETTSWHAAEPGSKNGTSQQRTFQSGQKLI